MHSIGGGEICVAFFPKKVSFLANIRCYAKFLEYRHWMLEPPLSKTCNGLNHQIGNQLSLLTLSSGTDFN